MAPRTGRKPPPPADPPATPPPSDHNQQGPLTQEDLDDLFLVHLAQARKDNDTIEKAKEALRAVQKIRTRNRNLCKTDGFPLKALDEILKDELANPSEVREFEDKRARMRGLANQPGGSLEQMDLFNDSFAQKERDEADWRGHGYTAGLRGLDNDVDTLNRLGVPAEFRQAWMDAWHEGQKRLAKAHATKMRIEGKPLHPETEAALDEDKPAEGAEQPAADDAAKETDEAPAETAEEPA